MVVLWLLGQALEIPLKWITFECYDNFKDSDCGIAIYIDKVITVLILPVDCQVELAGDQDFGVVRDEGAALTLDN